MTEPFQTECVAEKFANYPAFYQQKLLFLRDLIFQIAAAISEVGSLTETLLSECIMLALTYHLQKRE